MDGATLKAGAVAGLTRSAHPVSVARAVMEKTDHVMLAGVGAEIFAELNSLESVEPETLFTENRWSALERALRKRNLPIPPKPHVLDHGKSELVHDEGKHGTVGAVARDQGGNLAAATSTGGVTGKRFGRIGDSPIIGAGVYAANAACAVSATGDGEYFIRLGVARDIAALFEYRGLDIQAAADLVIQDKLTTLGGQGGVIAVAPNGHIAWSFNSEGMYRASAAEGREAIISIYSDEP
jgi:beta-aspartyl-peptidase (threonine type)